jgi:hypothetical protein
VHAGSCPTFQRQTPQFSYIPQDYRNDNIPVHNLRKRRSDKAEAKVKSYFVKIRKRHRIIE